MFWNDIEEIKESIDKLHKRFNSLDDFARESMHKALNNASMPFREGHPVCIRCDGDRVIDAGIEDIKELLCDVFSSEDENNTINRLHDKLDALLSDAVIAGEVLVAEKTLDKFEDYMKNVDKFNAMINEFKGCVSMARASISEGTILSKTIDEMKKVADISQHIHKSMLAFIRAGDNLEKKSFFKLNAIYNAVCEGGEKKSPKKRKTTKKKMVSPAL
jgi:hypothetical protein